MRSLIVLATVAFATAATAQTIPMTPELQKIVDGAKQEKTLITEMGPTVLGGQPLRDMFKEWVKKEQGIDVTINATPGGPFGVIGNKIATEFRAGQPSSTDVWVASPPQYHPYLRLDMFRKVEWLKLFPGRIAPPMVEADNIAFLGANGIPGIIYNIQTGGIFAQPKTIDDLLKPEYKGKFGTTAFANAFDAMAGEKWAGEAKMLDYIEKLAKQAQGILNCGAQDRVASGEFLALVLDCTGGSPEMTAYKGKIGLNILRDAAQLQYYSILIPKHARNPNMAVLYSVFLATPEAQAAMLPISGSNNALYPETQRAKLVKELEGTGIQFRHINYEFWLANPGISDTGNKMARALRSALGG